MKKNGLVAIGMFTMAPMMARASLPFTAMSRTASSPNALAVVAMDVSWEGLVMSVSR